MFVKPWILGALLAALLAGCGQSRGPEDDGVSGSSSGGSSSGGSSSGGATTSSCDPPRFEDDFLRRAVQTAAGGELSEASVANLSVLSARQGGVTALDGLECASGLRELELTGNAITELGPLARLERLEELRIDGNPLADLGPVSELRALRELSANDTRVADLSPLSGLLALETLIIARTPVSSFNPLASVNSLRALFAPDVRVTSLEPLLGKALTTLTLARAPLEDLALLGNFPQLVNLDVSETGATSLEPLNGFTDLAELVASGNDIERVDALVTMPKLFVVKLDRNRITELDALTEAPWTSPVELNFAGNPLSDHAVTDIIPELCARGFKVTADRVNCGEKP
jgi:Leucine-rich repeat (LRR) protein